jgi:hypothetical protein
VVWLRHAVEVGRREEGKLLVAVQIDHGSLTQRFVKPDAHRPVGVIAGPPAPRPMGVGAHEHTHIDQVLSLVHDDVTDTAVITAQRHSELKFANAPFSKAEGPAKALRVPVWATRRPFLAPPAVGWVVPFVYRFVAL